MRGRAPRDSAVLISSSFRRMIVSSDAADGGVVTIVWKNCVVYSSAEPKTSFQIRSASFRLSAEAAAAPPRRRPPRDLPASDIGPSTGESSGVLLGDRTFGGFGVDVPDPRPARAKNRTMKVNSAEPLSSSTRPSDRNSCSTGAV